MSLHRGVLAGSNINVLVMYDACSSFTLTVVVQKYVEKVRRLVSACRHDATGAAADELEALVSMRVRHQLCDSQPNVCFFKSNISKVVIEQIKSHNIL